MSNYLKLFREFKSKTKQNLIIIIIMLCVYSVLLVKCSNINQSLFDDIITIIKSDHSIFILIIMIVLHTSKLSFDFNNRYVIIRQSKNSFKIELIKYLIKNNIELYFLYLGTLIILLNFLCFPSLDILYIKEYSTYNIIYLFFIILFYLIFVIIITIMATIIKKKENCYLLILIISTFYLLSYSSTNIYNKFLLFFNPFNYIYSIINTEIIYLFLSFLIFIFIALIIIYLIYNINEYSKIYFNFLINELKSSISSKYILVINLINIVMCVYFYLITYNKNRNLELFLGLYKEKDLNFISILMQLFHISSISILVLKFLNRFDAINKYIFVRFKNRNFNRELIIFNNLLILFLIVLLHSASIMFLLVSSINVGEAFDYIIKFILVISLANNLILNIYNFRSNKLIVVINSILIIALLFNNLNNYILLCLLIVLIVINKCMLDYFGGMYENRIKKCM